MTRFAIGKPSERHNRTDSVSTVPCAYFRSERAAEFVTGVVVPIDGSFSAYCGV